MWAFSVAECGLDHDKFWDLSWFEWSLYARRHKLYVQEFQSVEENHWARFRIQWADFRNAHDKKKVKPEDLIKLSIDDHVEEEKPKLSIKQATQLLGRTFKKDGNK